MRIATSLFVMGFALFLVACSEPKAPAGRWEGVYEGADAMVAARLEIGADGLIRVSAPDFLDVGVASEDARVVLRERLARELASGWENVLPREMDFDGYTFRKPGGVAPQMEWDKKNKNMTLIAYFGTRPGLRIPMRGVKEFADDPFNP